MFGRLAIVMFGEGEGGGGGGERERSWLVGWFLNVLVKY